MFFFYLSPSLSLTSSPVQLDLRDVGMYMHVLCVYVVCVLLVEGFQTRASTALGNLLYSQNLSVPAVGTRHLSRSLAAS